MLQFHCSLSEQDYVRATLAPTYWKLPLVAIFGLWLKNAWELGRADLPAGFWASNLLYPVLLAILCWLYFGEPRRRYRLARRDFQQQEWRFTELGILLAFPRRAEGMKWAELRRWREYPGFILLFLKNSKRHFYIFPTKGQDPAKLEELRKLLRARL